MTAPAEVVEAVAGFVEAVRARGDAAGREYSARFDCWEPERFRLSEDEVARCVAALDDQTLDDQTLDDQTLDDQTLDDMRFAQAQVRRFADAQRASLRDVEIETLPGEICARASRSRPPPPRAAARSGRPNASQRRA